MAEFMPIITSVNHYFDETSISEGSWNNLIGTNNFTFYNVTVKEDRIFIDSNGYAHLEIPVTTECTRYAVLRTDYALGWAALISGGVLHQDLALYSSNSNKITIYANADYISERYFNPKFYTVIVYGIRNGKVFCYVNGTKIIEKTYSGTYENYVTLGRRISDGDYIVGCDYKFLAFADSAHTEEEIIENTNYLIKKYSIVDECWGINENKNNGYPYYTFTELSESFKWTEPIPKWMWCISPEHNDGYPYFKNVELLTEFKWTDPMPNWMWCLNSEINDGYPFFENVELLTKFEWAKPMPKWMWCISPEYNDGYPYLIGWNLKPAIILNYIEPIYTLDFNFQEIKKVLLNFTIYKEK